MGGTMRWLTNQKATSALPITLPGSGSRLVRAPASSAARKATPIAGVSAQPRACRPTKTPIATSEGQAGPDPDPELEADQGVGRRGAEQGGQRGRGEADAGRVAERADDVAALAADDLGEALERGLEVDPGGIGRAGE